MIAHRVKKYTQYNRIESEFRERILRGEYPEDAALPGELTLSRQYSVSRKTVRKALENLRTQNFIRKQKGSGNYVIPAGERRKMDRITGKICIMLPEREIQSSFEREAVGGIQKFAAENNIEVIRGLHSDSARKLLEMYHNFEADAFVWCSFNADRHDAISELAACGVPQVVIDRKIGGTASVLYESLPTWRTLLNLLRAQGHRSIAFVERPEATEWALERQRTFLQAAREYQCRAEIVKIPFDRADELKKRMAERRDITAYVCISPWFKTFMEILDSLRLKVPEDLSLVEFTSEGLDPLTPVTRVYVPTQNMAWEAARLLTEWDFRKEDGPVCFIPCYVVAGLTTGAAPRR